MTPPPYGLKQALLGLFVGLWFVILPGYGLYAMATETVQCARAPGEAPACRLVRRVAAIPVRDQALGAVRGASLESTYSSPRFFQSRRSEGGYTFTVRYDTPGGPVDGASGPSRDDLQAMVDGVNGFLADGSMPSFEITSGGGPLLWRLALGVLFSLGVLFLVNIPLATIQALRGRPASG